jgi:hypothetical protein
VNESNAFSCRVELGLERRAGKRGRRRWGRESIASAWGRTDFGRCALDISVIGAIKWTD